MIDKALLQLIRKSEEALKRSTDYCGDDGFLYCGDCHTRKQTDVDMPWGKQRVFVMCRCEKEREDKFKEALAEKERKERIEARKKKAFPSFMMRDLCFENDDGENEKLTAAMHRYVDLFEDFRKTGKGLLLYGRTGTGKTFAACEVANALCEKGYSVLVSNFASLSNGLQSAYDKNEYLNEINENCLLIIDDLGAERNSAYMNEVVYNIIDRRHVEGKPMIITTNLSIEEIKNPQDRNSSRIYERILERCHPIEVNTTNKRRKNIRATYSEVQKLLGLETSDEES